MSPQSKHGAAISSRDVTVRYGQILALDNFSVDIPEGVVGLLGPNGAGKSTFIKSILGLVQPQKGTMRIAGRDPRTELDVVRDMIGYMPEHDCLIDSFSAVELVTFMGQVSGMRKKDAIPRSHEVLDFVGVGEERYRLISSYSTGMKQRVKLAQAIVHDPGILFLDEPTNGMDPQGREDMLALISKIKDSEKSILVSSHILHDVEKVSSRAVIIHNGKLVTEGDIDQLLAKDEGRHVLKLRGAPENRDRFADEIGKNFDVLSAVKEAGQTILVLFNKDDGNRIFEMARGADVQIRAYYPERASLEDFFIGTLDVQTLKSGQTNQNGQLQEVENDGN